MKIRGFYPYWRCHTQEKALNEAAARGLQLEKAHLLSNEYRQDESKAYRLCIAMCGAPKKSASRLQWELAWQREGWEKVCERGKLTYFRTPAESKAKPLKENALPALFKRRIHSMELWRIVLLVLVVVCIMFGYAIDKFMIVRASVIPLGIALVITLVISKMQKATAYIENR